VNEWFVLALYGLVQGLTEFLPVSSDGHLAIAAMFLGDIVELPLGTVLLLHLGTLVATLLVLQKDAGATLTATLRAASAPRTLGSTAEGRTALTVLIASVPTALVGLALRDDVEPLATRPAVVGACLLMTAAFVGSTRWSGPRARLDEPSLDLGPALVLGLAQGLAVLPGLSRSGTTIAVAMLLGLRPEAAFRLSFLLSLPAVAGAVLLELRHPEVWADAGLPGVLGALVAFAVGVLALRWLRRWLAQGRFEIFAAYCTLLGLALLGLALGGRG
jgi:undecaprenyl-diphosphatase